MADQHHGLSLCDEEIFKPLYRLDVQMVGRFVKEQHVGLGQQEFCKLDAHAPAAGKLGCRTIEVGPHKTKAHKSLFHLSLAVVRCLHGYAVGQRGHFLDELMI